MQYTLIKGNFHVVGYSPDGDSMMFKAADNDNWKMLNMDDNDDKFSENFKNGNGAVQLRLQGIDALETHYSAEPLKTPDDLKSKETDAVAKTKPKPKEFKQPTDIGKDAAEAFMHFLGVRNIDWKNVFSGRMVERASLTQKGGQDVWITEKQADMIPGYIVASDVEKSGRPLAWVFAGTCPDKDGAGLSKEQLAARVNQSANYHLLEQGLVYPYYFMTLAGALREKLSTAVKAAQKAATKSTSNLWAYDKTAQGVKIPSIKTIAEETVIYPYLFRKVIKTQFRQNMELYWEALKYGKKFSYNSSDTSVDLGKFFDNGNPWVFVISDQDFVKLDEIIEMKNGTLRMKKQPSELVFLS